VIAPRWAPRLWVVRQGTNCGYPVAPTSTPCTGTANPGRQISQRVFALEPVVARGRYSLPGIRLSQVAEEDDSRGEGIDQFVDAAAQCSTSNAVATSAVGRKKRQSVVRRKAKFDPKIFLANVGAGKTISKFRKDQIVFSQGESRTRFFTSSKARSSSLLFPSKARRRWLQSWDQVSSLAKDV
jgi:hypothetical protein